MEDIVGCAYHNEENSPGKLKRVFFQMSEGYNANVVRTEIPKPDQKRGNHEVEKLVRGKKGVGGQETMQIWEKLRS